ncbi:hypothetical protein GJ496_011813 [Pomphorhynchus laevis]|nr:hypothetical protein GJ496_011813 [Pomphorhynchus laevis]
MSNLTRMILTDMSLVVQPDTMIVRFLIIFLKIPFEIHSLVVTAQLIIKSVHQWVTDCQRMLPRTTIAVYPTVKQYFNDITSTNQQAIEEDDSKRLKVVMSGSLYLAGEVLSILNN